MTAANAPLGGATPSKKRSNDKGDPDAAFCEIVDRAIAERAGIGPGSPSPEDPDPATLVRYAAGALEGEARAEVEASLARSTWAYRCVLALVRHSKASPERGAAALPHQVARHLLRGAREKRGKLQVTQLLTTAFTEAGAAVAASAAPSDTTRADFGATADALKRGDEDGALASAIAALMRAAPPGEAII
jgi:hypothetical protein